MKLMIPPFSIILFMLSMDPLILYISIMSLIVMYMLIKFNMKYSILLSTIMMDPITSIMILLTLISIILILLSSSSLYKISIMIIPITLILLMTFLSKHMLSFYIMFELVLIPTMILITLNGKQPERLQASIYLIIYTMTGSLPLLMSIIFCMNNTSFMLSNVTLMKFSMILFLMMAFLAKMPMYMIHLWLPKAHVEAPLEGSMILAAVLLKLGGYGIIRFIPMCIMSINKMNSWIISISIIGATATSMNCIRQKDLKSLIAYSSVAHMGFVLCALFTFNTFGLTGAIIMMIAHGLSSSALFLLVNDLYIKYHSRNTLLFKGLIIIMPNITFWWFMFMALNISAPPTINTISEILMMTSMISWNNITIPMIFLMSLMTASFSLMMFISIIHNKNEMLPSIHTPQKIFTSLFIHFIPSIIMIMKPELMYMCMSSLYKTMTCGVMNSYIKNMTMIIFMLMTIPMSSSFMMMYYNMYSMIKISLTNLSFMLISADLILDWMSLLFLATVMLISSLIILFSKYYIPCKEQKQFLLLLLMFVLSMAILIMSNNLFMILLGWDGLGLSSYILVVYYQNFSSASSGTITLLSNRVGDILILMSMGMLTLSSNWSFNLNSEYSLLILLLLTIAACSKSAQFPFSAWLPMAMAAPTPISALVHSSTLVTAGVFLMLRLSDIHPYTLIFLLIISSSTTIYASMSANWEQDMKKIIALSTLSQIAMMMFAISLKSLILAFLHLIIHALFKSAMFLCAGIMIHESSYQDMRMMGLNFFQYPLTLSILGINSLALMGVPFMSGFFSKDVIIEFMMMSNLNFTLSTLMILSIGMTASYSLRMTLFSNKPLIKSQAWNSNHQSINCLIPIIMLSMMAITSGSWLTWILSSEQLFLISFQNKILILIILLTGTLLGFMFQFKNKKYLKLGSSSISLWFTHFISVIPTNILSPLMSLFQNNDKSWQENYGPEKSYSMLMMNSPLPENFKSSMMMIVIMILITPMILL